MSDATSLAEYSHFFQVRLNLFDGPIDLLLHLVKKNELPIEKVSLAEVASQYLECIEQMKQFDLEVAGEYLVIAATLLSIKSSILLNDPVELVIDEEGNLVDPHELLLQKLREAQVYRDGALYLSGRELLDVDVFPTPSSLDEVEPPPVRFKDHDPILLGLAFKKLLDKVGDAAPVFTISFDSVSIVDRMVTILDTLKAAGGSKAFKQLIPDLTSRASVIASFIALLELCKRQAIHVRQDKVFDEIYIVISDAPVPAQPMSSEFDEVEEAVVESVNG